MHHSKFHLIYIYNKNAQHYSYRISHHVKDMLLYSLKHNHMLTLQNVFTK